MYDIRWIRENPDAFDRALKARGLEPLADQVLALDKDRRQWTTEAQESLGRRNSLTKQIGKAKASGEDADALIREVGDLKQSIQQAEEKGNQASGALQEILGGIPNAPDSDVPIGEDESANVEIRRWGDPRQFNFDPKQHFEIGDINADMDFETASRLSGSRFVVLRGRMARLERALAQFMLDIHTLENGYTEISGPLLVREHTAYGTGNLPKFAEDLFQTKEGFYLIPTAEMTLTNLVREQILAHDELPLRFTSFTPCFRSEAGSAGRDTRGMIRLHQFPKVEMVSITAAEDSKAEHDRMTACAEGVLQRLELPYRVVTLSSGDMGFSARRTYDLEVWLPGQNTYREISSCSNCGDFQARRMNARYRDADGKKGTRFVHTLNGSGLAVGRTLIAILENYQQADGSVSIPTALQPYLGGVEQIGP